MKIEKLNLKSIKNVLSRAELKQIMAGSGPAGPCETVGRCNPSDGSMVDNPDKKCCYACWPAAEFWYCNA